jgi:hypothetical protein
MKRLATVISILPVLAFAAGCGKATATVTGSYTTTITTPSAAGTYTLDFKKDGSGTVAVNGELSGHTFTWKGSTLTAPGGGENVCPTAGTYKIHLAGKHLTLTVIHDPCTIGRAQIFPGHTWTKVG